MPLPIYEPGQASAYVTGKGWPFRRTGDHLVLASCIFCAKKDKLYINDSSGLWVCHSGGCGQKGNFYQLQKTQGDTELVRPLAQQQAQARKETHAYTLDKFRKLQDALAQSETGLAYLASRGLTPATAQAFHLGFSTKIGIGEIAIPYVRDGFVVDVKYRVLPEFEDGRPKYRRLGEKVGMGESVLFGQHTLAAGKQEGRSTLYLVEGEFDAMVLWQHGFWPALSTTTGANSFKPEWYDAIVSYGPDELVICYDADVAGQKAAQTLAQRFENIPRVRNVVLPDVKDATEFFLKYTDDDFRTLLEQSPLPEVENVLSMVQVNNQLEEELFLSSNGFNGVQSQFDEINTMLAGGYWFGQFIVVTAPSGTGKTSFTLQELLWQAKTLNLPSYLLCLEMPEVMMLRKIYAKEFGIPMLQLTLDHVAKYRKSLDKLQLYLGSKCRKLSDVEKTVRQAVARFGVRCVVFDNVNYFVRSIEHNAQEIAAVTKLLKDLAVELDIAIIGIAQPKKFDRRNQAMDNTDLAYGSALEQDADSIVILQRQLMEVDMKKFGKGATAVSLGTQSPYTMVRITKARYAPGGRTFLYFDGFRSTYRVLTEEEKQALEAASE